MRTIAQVGKAIAVIKAAMPKVYHDVVQRAMHLRSNLGASNDMPFTAMLVDAQVMAVANGPTEVHKFVLARQLLQEHPAAAAPLLRVPAQAHPNGMTRTDFGLSGRGHDGFGPAARAGDSDSPITVGN